MKNTSIGPNPTCQHNYKFPPIQGYVLVFIIFIHSLKCRKPTTNPCLHKDPAIWKVSPPLLHAFIFQYSGCPNPINERTKWLHSTLCSLIILGYGLNVCECLSVLCIQKFMLGIFSTTLHPNYWDRISRLLTGKTAWFWRLHSPVLELQKNDHARDHNDHVTWVTEIQIKFSFWQTSTLPTESSPRRLNFSLWFTDLPHPLFLHLSVYNMIIWY